ncbi:MAG TPA: hypothetical protein VHA37_09540, partial [Candidatus Saccharimonadales bacterium]|nr:hypothetical protein [Candidatus Saccharimonadales bacterium]
VSTRDRGGNGGEVKVTVESAREISSQQASDYQPTGRQVAAPPATIAVAKPLNERLYIRLHDTNDEQTLLSLKETIDNHRGSTEVVLVLGDASARQAIKLPGGIDTASDGLSELRELVGVDNLVIQ